MIIGNMYTALAVKNIEKSLDFYQNIGFSFFGGDIEQKYVILKNEYTYIGLFEGIFESNVMCFNPGWGPDGVELEKFDTVEELKNKMETNNVNIEEFNVNDDTTGSFKVTDPDGNKILFEQFRQQNN